MQRESVKKRTFGINSLLWIQEQGCASEERTFDELEKTVPLHILFSKAR